MSNSETSTGPRFSADSGIKMRDSRNGLYLDEQEQLEFASAMQALEGAADPDQEAHRSPGNTYYSEDQARRHYNNMHGSGNDKLDETTLTAVPAFEFPNPANVVEP